ncbi:glycerophosphodiester phosphodiesterase family protein [Sphingobium phenoxybenzoativorans]|uniref:glycerophosphodiester phosphodiesterase family protein n=1 Tax=Sphingobium phenoxybenzoativorans TaxID=1592790 RepID=UPI001FE80579|nr:glycerophosphodiester phosphodiesterase family protein [Sphingobium phenoxybenzoativorans]
MSPFARLDSCLSPAPDAARVAFLRAQPFAHRGLHGKGLVENSLAAFDAAIAAGYGMECDVRASQDGVAFVFHDADLDRLTAEKGKLADRSASLLDAVILSGAREPLPRLDALLHRIDGRAPLLIEVKAPTRNVIRICRATRRALEGYRGPVAIMSFNPLVASWFRREAPHIVRGLVVTEEGKQGYRGRIARTLALWKAKPDFLAYDVRDLPSRFPARARQRGLPVLTWTVRNAAAEQVAFAHADESIFEIPGDG